MDDEVKVCSDLINKFVLAVTYRDDLEQQLNFYVECRASFIKLDAVLVALVQVSTFHESLGTVCHNYASRQFSIYHYLSK